MDLTHFPKAVIKAWGWTEEQEELPRDGVNEREREEQRDKESKRVRERQRVREMENAQRAKLTPHTCRIQQRKMHQVERGKPKHTLHNRTTVNPKSERPPLYNDITSPINECIQ